MDTTGQTWILDRASELSYPHKLACPTRWVPDLGQHCQMPRTFRNAVVALLMLRMFAPNSPVARLPVELICAVVSLVSGVGRSRDYNVRTSRRRFGNFRAINSVAVDCDGTIVVVDREGNGEQFVWRFLQEEDGRPASKFSFGERGIEKHCFNEPCSVAFDGDLLVILETGFGRVQYYQRDGKFVRAIERVRDNHKPARGQMMNLAVSSRDGAVFLVDPRMDRVLVFERDGAFRCLLPVPQPRSIVFLANGDLVVGCKDALVMFAHDLAHLRTWDPAALGFSFEARGLALDADENLVVADCANQSIFVLRLEDSFVLWRPALGLYRPVAVAVAPNGEILVANFVDYSGHVLIT